MASPGNKINKPSHADQVSERRRRLLKAAVASAPVIATLQSGAAFANTSAFQCINSTATDTPLEAILNLDGYARRTISATEYKHPTQPSKWKYEVSTGVFLDENGISWPATDPAGYTAEASVSANVLVYYTPNADNMGVTEQRIFPQQQSIQDQVLAASCMTSIISS